MPQNDQLIFIKALIIKSPLCVYEVNKQEFDKKFLRNSFRSLFTVSNCSSEIVCTAHNTLVKHPDNGCIILKGFKLKFPGSPDENWGPRYVCAHQVSSTLLPIIMLTGHSYLITRVHYLKYYNSVYVTGIFQHCSTCRKFPVLLLLKVII